MLFLTNSLNLPVPDRQLKYTVVLVFDGTIYLKPKTFVIAIALVTIVLVIPIKTRTKILFVTLKRGISSSKQASSISNLTLHRKERHRGRIYYEC